MLKDMPFKPDLGLTPVPLRLISAGTAQKRQEAQCISREGQAGGDVSLTQSHLEMAWGLPVPSEPPLEQTTGFAQVLNANFSLSVLAKAAKVKARGRVQNRSTRAEQCLPCGGLTPVTTSYWLVRDPQCKQRLGPYARKSGAPDCSLGSRTCWGDAAFQGLS